MISGAISVCRQVVTVCKWEKEGRKEGRRPLAVSDLPHLGLNFPLPPSLLSIPHNTMPAATIPDTLSEVHGRLYTRAIAPLANLATVEPDDVCADLLETLMTPADMYNYPSLFGPADDDPLHALFAHDTGTWANPLASRESLSVAGGKERLRGVYEEMKRGEGRTIQSRFLEEGG
jgi:hypothetical protein